MRNRDTYQKRIAKLKRDAPAYKNYDDAKLAYSKKDFDQALSLANKAIAAQDQESLFYELKGAALEAKGTEQQALLAYNRAIDLNSQYYSHYLRRGLLRQSLGDTAGANRDFAASNKLLPTATENYQLGNTALASGNEKAALAYFGQSAVGNSPMAQQSQLNIARIEIKSRPGKYIATQTRALNDGRLAFQVVNKSPLTVNKVTLDLVRRDGYKWARVKTLTVKGPLAPGKSSRVQLTGLNNIVADDQANYQMRVLKAE